MDIKELKKRLVKRLAAHLIIIVAFSVGYVFLDQYNEDTNQKRQWIRNDINALRSELESFNKKALKFAEAVTIWQKLPDNKKIMSGLRITDGNVFIDELESKYYVDASVTFSKPATLKEYLTSETVSVLESEVNVRIKGLSDKHIFSFVKEITDHYPGYVRIISLKLEKRSSVTKEILREIASGEQPELVTGELVFIWNDFKYEKQDDKKGNV